MELLPMRCAPNQAVGLILKNRHLLVDRWCDRARERLLLSLMGGDTARVSYSL